jgi:Uma2 family endonuclease
MASRSAEFGEWTVAQLHALPDDGNKYEIIDGVLYVTPSPRFLHERAVAELAWILRPYATPLGFAIMPRDGDVKYSERTLVQPDAFVYISTAERKVRDWADVHPLQLVIEVLSRSTKRRDRTVKRDLYQGQRIPQYWIVDLDLRVIEVWTPDAVTAERHTEQLRWQPVATEPPLLIDLVAYFSDLLD